MTTYNPNWAKLDLIPKGSVILPATVHNGAWIQMQGTQTIDRVARLFMAITKTAGGAVSIPVDQIYLQVAAIADGSTGIADVPQDNLTIAPYNLLTPCAGLTVARRYLEIRCPGPFVRAVVVGDGVDQFTFDEALSLYIPLGR